MPSLAYWHAIFGVITVLNLGVLAPLIFVWHDMVAISSCKQQHESLIIVWESFPSSLTFFCYCCCSLRYDNKGCLLHHQHCVVALQSYYLWRFMPSQLSMWLIHIDQKGLLSLVQSCLLVAINRCRHSLQCNKNNIIVIIASCNTALRNDHPISMMLLALQCISLQVLCAFAIFACSLAMLHKDLVGCCMAQSCIPLSQSTILVIASCNARYTVCLLPSLWQWTACKKLIVAS
jgi:hypothetical protein